MICLYNVYCPLASLSKARWQVERGRLNVSLKSESIWSGEMSQPPFKVEITPEVLVLLGSFGVCLFLGDFCTFLAV